MGKILGRKSYGSIPHLQGSRTGIGDHTINDGMQRIATIKTRDKYDLVIVQEKLDGSNVGIAKISGTIYPIIRSGYLASESSYRQHHFFNEWVYYHQQRFASLLQDGERICGEWLIQAHGTKYDLPHEPFVAFDIIRETDRVPYCDFADICRAYRVTIPRLLHIGNGAFSVENAIKKLEDKSCHGAIDFVEGAVWRVERKGKVDFLCKYVCPTKKDGCYFPEKEGNATKSPVWNSFVGDNWLAEKLGVELLFKR